MAVVKKMAKRVRWAFRDLWQEVRGLVNDILGWLAAGAAALLFLGVVYILIRWAS